VAKRPAISGENAKGSHGGPSFKREADRQFSRHPAGWCFRICRQLGGPDVRRLDHRHHFFEN
jgi:hypothetical protein